ncbi:MAG TPA: cytochrome b/b6 domain-containing protein [Acetobacteraceae bacterium]|nr:cytochrome b/b6 domain-containing protein [Acetobacteraceae bacterium]
MRHSPKDYPPLVVWDLPVRLFHWLTVVLIATAYVTWRLNWMAWHAYAGEAVLALVLFRLAWGLIGSDTARFRHFMASPATAIRHLTHAFRREPDTQIGHNAAGGWMVLLLLALLLGQTLTGIIDNNDIADAGPLTDIMPAWVANLIDNLHTWLWNALLAAIALHLLAIASYALAKGHNLVRPMLTGRKALPRDRVAPRLASTMLAVLMLAGSAAVAALLASFL